MSSRIIRGNAAGIGAPIEWQSAGGGAGHPGADSGGPGADDALPQQIRQAYQAGFQEGQAAAQQEHQTVARPLIERLTETLAAFGELRARVRRESEQEVVELSIAIAKRVLHRELTLDPETVRGLVKVAFERLGARELNRVRAHPSHSELIHALLEKACPDRRVELVADPAMGPGDVVFETERGDLDASVGSQLEEIRRGLADHLEV